MPKTTRTGSSIAGGVVPRSRQDEHDTDLYMDGRRVVPGAPPQVVCLFAQNGFTLPTGAGLAEIPAARRARAKVDLTGYTECRVSAGIDVAGGAGQVLGVQYSTDDSTWLTLSSSANQPEAAVNVAGTRVSAWVPLAAGAQADVFLRPYSRNGDGVTAGTLGTLLLQVR